MNILRFLLFPLSVIYSIPVFLRNFLYNKNIFKSTVFDIPTIVIGNLCTGGSGKSPHTLLIAKHLSKKGKNVAILSRGYGRTSIGFREVEMDSSAKETGDEPLMFKLNLREKVRIFVDRNRVNGIIKIAEIYPDVDVILLDDAFQHRALKGGLNILLSRASKPFFKDFLLPTGNLREPRSGYKRADILVFTKNEPSVITNVREFVPRNNIPVFYSSYQYTSISPVFEDTEIIKEDAKGYVLVTGIANGKAFKAHYENKGEVTWVNYRDHHNYTLNDLNNIHKIFNKLAHSNKIIVTTEKDAVKIKPLLSTIDDDVKRHWFIQKIEPEIESEEAFFNLIENYVERN